MNYHLLIYLILGNSFVESARNPLLLVSFDGFRSEKFEAFIAQNPKSSLARFAAESSRAQYMVPSFPSVTFSNHITLVTGLYPESHGIVHNTVYDPVFNKKLRLAGNTDPKWWDMFDPIWNQAKKQGLRTASSFWVSNDVYPKTPDIFLSYNADSANYTYDRVDDLVRWFEIFNLDFACMYFDQPDATGHAFGPDSEEYADKVAEMDKVFGYLINKLSSAGFLKKINIIVVSDHGMAALKENMFINMRDYPEALALINSNNSVLAEVSNIFLKDEQRVNFKFFFLVCEYKLDMILQ